MNVNTFLCGATAEADAAYGVPAVVLADYGSADVRRVVFVDVVREREQQTGTAAASTSVFKFGDWDEHAVGRDCRAAEGPEAYARLCGIAFIAFAFGATTAEGQHAVFCYGTVCEYTLEDIVPCQVAAILCIAQGLLYTAVVVAVEGEETEFRGTLYIYRRVGRDHNF